eukprot:6409565-Prymnesium_polylepis.2
MARTRGQSTLKADVQAAEFATEGPGKGSSDGPDPVFGATSVEYVWRTCGSNASSAGSATSGDAQASWVSGWQR